MNGQWSPGIIDIQKKILLMEYLMWIEFVEIFVLMVNLEYKKIRRGDGETLYDANTHKKKIKFAYLV